MAALSASVLNTLYEQASEVLDAAARKMGEANKEHEDERAKLVMLQGYRQDYVNNMQKLMSRGVGKETHQNYQHFLVKLDQAIEGQEEMVVMAHHRLDTQRELLQEAQRKKKSFEILLNRQQHEQHKKTLKREQKLMDEFASRKRQNGAI